MRLVHLSDLHVWRLDGRPWRLFGKRALGMANLLLRRRRRFPRALLRRVLTHVLSLRPDHLVITGDLTQTALAAEFRDCRAALAPLLAEPARTTVIPGNHDRYTREALRARQFERYFGAFGAACGFPFTRDLGPDLRLIALDPCRPTGLTARGHLPLAQLRALEALLCQACAERRRAIVVCHYPVVVPAAYANPGHALDNAPALHRVLAGAAGPVLLMHGHVHRAWAFALPGAPQVICVGAGSSSIARADGTHAGIGPLSCRLTPESVTIERHAPITGGGFEPIELGRFPFALP